MERESWVECCIQPTIGYAFEIPQIGYTNSKKKSHKPLWLMAL